MTDIMDARDRAALEARVLAAEARAVEAERELEEMETKCAIAEEQANTRKYQRDAAESRSLAAEAEAERLREALEKAEWNGEWAVDDNGNTVPTCPVCGHRWQRHAETCELRAALATKERDHG